MTYELIRSNEDMERTVLVKSHILPTPNPSQRFPIFRCSPIRQCFEAGHEARELLLPVMQCGRGGYDEERTPEIMMFRQVG